MGSYSQILPAIGFVYTCIHPNDVPKLLQAELEVAQKQVCQLQADVAAKQATQDAQAQEIHSLRHNAQQQQAALEEVNAQTLQKHEQLTKITAELTVSHVWPNRSWLLSANSVCFIHAC